MTNSTHIRSKQPTPVEAQPKPPKCRALTDEIRRLAIEMFALGYTVRTIRQQVIDRLNVEPSEAQLMQLAIAYAPNIEQARRELSKMAIEAGLADKGVRVARLGILADAWANSAEHDTKAAGIYLRTLEQINKELEPFGLGAVPPDLDPWGKLLQGIRDRANPPELPPGTTETPNDASR